MSAAQTVIGIAVAAGFFAGGGIGAVAYKVESVRHDVTRAKLQTLEINNSNAIIEAQTKSRTAQALIDSLTVDLERAKTEREVITIETVREIERVASPTHVCLRPPARRVLGDASAGKTTVSEGPRVTAAPGPAPAGDPRRHPADEWSTSEAAMTRWAHEVKVRYRTLADQKDALAQIVLSIPGVEIDESR
jgi:hypothetical protein